MKAEHVNAFLVPSVSVIKKMAKVDVKIGKIAKLDSPEVATSEHKLSIIIGVKGNLSGSVILSSTDGVARALAGAIIKTTPDSITESDLNDIMAELANTIVGNATGALYDLGIKAGITPPTVVLGSGLSFCFDSGMDSVRIQLLMDVGEMIVTVSLTRENP